MRLQLEAGVCKAFALILDFIAYRTGNILLFKLPSSVYSILLEQVKLEHGFKSLNFCSKFCHHRFELKYFLIPEFGKGNSSVGLITNHSSTFTLMPITKMNSALILSFTFYDL